MTAVLNHPSLPSYLTSKIQTILTAMQALHQTSLYSPVTLLNREMEIKKQTHYVSVVLSTKSNKTQT